MMDARAAIIWGASALGIAFILADPLVSLLIVLAAACVASRSEDSLPFRTLLTVGLIGVGVRTAMFALTGHEGETILLKLPQVSLPFGLAIGGAVTVETLISSAMEGVRLLTVLAVIGALISIVPTIELLRLLPFRLRDAGLVLNIAIAFAPQVVMSARDIRDAGRTRSQRGSRISSLASLIVPVVATATERSITLAEAMDSRGYGRAATRRPSRLRPRSWTRNDRIAAVVSIVAVLAAVLITSIDGSVTNTSTLMPTAPLAGLVLATSLAIPAFLGGDR